MSLNSTIADLILEKGRAQAAGALGSGNAWGTAIGQVGQTVGNAFAQQTDPHLQNDRTIAAQNALKLKESQQFNQGQQQVDSMMQGDQLPAGASGPRQPSYLDENGLFDVPKLTAALGSSGMGHLAPDLLKGAEAINDSITKHQGIEQQAANATTLLIGDMADGALKLSKTGMPLVQAMDFVAQPALATKRIQPQQYAQVRAQISNLPPDQQAAALTQFMDSASKVSGNKTLAKDAIETDRYGRTTGSNVVPEKPTETSLAVDAATLGTPNETPTAKQSAAALATLKPAPKAGPEQDDQRYRNIQAALVQKQTVSPLDLAWAQGYEKQKTLGPETTAAAAANRQSLTLAAQVAQQARAQKFTEQQAGRSELTTKVEQPYLDAVEKADTLRTVVDAAKGGNLQAAAVQSLLGTLGLVTTEGVKRINSTELAQTAGAGSLLDRIKNAAGKVTEGQPVDPKLQDDLQQLSGILEKNAYSKYINAHKATTQRYGLTDEAPLPAPSSAASGPKDQLKANATHRVVQGGVTYDVTTDGSGKVVSSVKVP